VKSFLKNNKQIISEILLFSIAVILLFVFMNINNVTIAGETGDFVTQHVRFIDYLRNSFWQTNELFPEMTMNYATTTSMSSLIYYGYLNPIIMLSYFFPSLNTMYLLQIIYALVIVGSFSSMNLLLRRFNIRRDIVITISILTAFTPIILFEMSNHIMFIYYFPISILAFYALDKLIKENKKVLFIICIAMLFFTNVFFALSIGYVQLLFYFSTLFFKYDFNKKEKIKKTINLIKSYFVGILIGMVTFVPQAISILSSDRSSNIKPEIDFFTLSRYTWTVFRGNEVSFAGIFIALVLILGLINFRHKFTIGIVIGILIPILFGYMAYLLNLLQYINARMMLYFVPLCMFLVAYMLNEKKIKLKAVAVILSFIFAFAMGYVIRGTLISNFTKHDFFYMIGFQFLVVMILILMYKKTKFKNVLLPIVIVGTVISTFGSSTGFMSHDRYSSHVLREQDKYPNFYNDQLQGFFRINGGTVVEKDDRSSFIGAINEFTPLMYSSIMNPNYEAFLNNVDIQRTSQIARKTIAPAIRNSLFKNIFSIVNTNSNNEIVYDDVRPFIFGVDKNDAFNTDDLKQLSSSDKLIALNQHFFANTSDKILNLEDEYKILIYEGKEELKFEKSTSIEVEIPKEYQKPGVILVESEVISDKIGRATVNIDGFSTLVRPINFWGEPANKVVNIYREYDGKDEVITIKFTKSNKNIYAPLKVNFIDYEKIQKKTLEYIPTSNDIIDFNKSFNFDLNMPNDGYLGTSIFYDPGFIIKVDGKEVDKIKVNEYFLGAKLEKGEHSIEITYQMQGFTIGKILTVIGLIFFVGVIASEKRSRKTSFLLNGKENKTLDE